MAMRGGRKNLKRATEEKHITLQDGQGIMQVVSLRGANIIEVMDASGNKLLALFPAKIQKSMWIKRGSFVVVDESGKEKALESGSKVACLVSQVLFSKQVRELEKSPAWPESFKSAMVDDSIESTTSQQEHELEGSDDDGLPPLEANTNRIRPAELQADDEDSESSSDTDDD
ncbi:probable RNA-binding protein EIF1AD [Glycine soja]|uniref:Putative RNA-binding protein EIF1AD n=1 Tax=Glycine soja TaxID=3848 RepID=A0A0B2R1M4_GLYSO|nr:probable RNA-binding protein EIF1AD [Glycine soja]XP_028236281.1 probable RNA-binding protein EIF1AD [Glycine soja]XP_028236282.1 probable RNA-binding protein EIF1AD [Glycine soja]XP_028236283.1 probable RNA-binding protein EIF1AD [Glycine soja]KHN25797.1 Putative RNA-binding protein EIF1AD [Glycine soja]RZC07467.1 putative RNA-binding protein EIF1AD isoform A [Glycine soja]RZC07468.1 putative RNA-binding protein EIF1AD isoform B [Glycine soja]RZC07469.1 putative RNA-binding protein EIF1A